MNRISSLSIGLLLLACKPSIPLEQAESKGFIHLEENILADNQKVHIFSNHVKPDTFKIKLIGDSVHTATATFEIISGEGKLIYNETFDANYLLNYDLPLESTEAQKNEFILSRISNFFTEENFKVPAIKSDMTFDSNYSDRAIWQDIKRDNGAIDFYYLLGKEDGRWIAYSKTQNKVVLYFNCC